MNAQLVFYIGKKLAHFVKEFEAYSPEVGELDPETETRDAVIRNPLCPDDDSEAMYVEFGDEFTVYWHGHRHFSPEDYWYDMMVEWIRDILDGRVGYAAFLDDGGKTLAVSTCRAENIHESMTRSDAAGLMPTALIQQELESATLCRIHMWGRESLEIPMK